MNVIDSNGIERDAVLTGIQPDQVLRLKERFPRRRRGAALISVTSTEMRARRSAIIHLAAAVINSR
jgi:hypothetical protein